MDTIIDSKKPAGTRKRRTYTEAQRLQILEEAARPGASVASVARRHGINDNVVFTWRKQRHGSPPRMLPVTVTQDSAGKNSQSLAIHSIRQPSTGSCIEIRTASGHVVQIGAGADAQMVQIILATLRA